MAKISFSYSTTATDKEGKEYKDGGIVSFKVNFSEEPIEDYRRMCCVTALDEVTNNLCERYNDTSLFDGIDDIDVSISGFNVTA